MRLIWKIEQQEMPTLPNECEGRDWTYKINIMHIMHNAIKTQLYYYNIHTLHLNISCLLWWAALHKTLMLEGKSSQTV